VLLLVVRQKQGRLGFRPRPEEEEEEEKEETLLDKVQRT
jgi:hypothetical protein